jgi:hypothetical protein
MQNVCFSPPKWGDSERNKLDNTVAYVTRAESVQILNGAAPGKCKTSQNAKKSRNFNVLNIRYN